MNEKKEKAREKQEKKKRRNEKHGHKNESKTERIKRERGKKYKEGREGWHT